jgi:hypothetical protein
MNLTSTSWRCLRCGGTVICDPPGHRLCGQCLEDLETLARAAVAETLPCPSCGGPVCRDCGDALIVVVPAALPAASTELAGQVVAAYCQHSREVTGDDR